jgi:aryl-alcohol dehydrogenase-like predicted oxidoreductase
MNLSDSEIRAATQLADQLNISLVSSQPQYSMLWRLIEEEVVPTCDELGIGQIVCSPFGQGAKAAGVHLDHEIMKKIDEVLTVSPATRP